MTRRPGVPRWRSRLGAARQAVRDVRETRDSVAAMSAELDSVSRALEQSRAELEALRSELAQRDAHQLEVLRVIADEEAANRRRLEAVRASKSYAEPFEAGEPLVSIPIPTYSNHAALESRALPSALGQTYQNIEVVVVGDAAPPETQAVVERMGDPRIRYVNLGHRGPYPEDEQQRWHVAGTMALNESFRLCRGPWIAPLNDDDAFRPDHVASLLEAARTTRAEVVYGKLLQHAPDGSELEIGSFPPRLGGFGWQAAMFHRDLRFFGWQLAAALFEEPGDWSLCRRMLRAGVSFAMVDAVVSDYYPERSWVRPDSAQM